MHPETPSGPFRLEDFLLAERASGSDRDIDDIVRGRESRLRERIRVTQEKERDCTVHSDYSQGWRRLLETQPELRTLLARTLRGDILLDLGGGIPQQNSAVPDLAKEAGVRVYINVDRFAFLNEDVADNVNIREATVDEGTKTYRELLAEEYGPMEYICVAADLLAFLQRMPDNSCSISIHGIDDLIIRDPQYHEVLKREIVRVCRPGGFILGCESGALDRLLLEGNPGFDQVFQSDDNGTPEYILRKKAGTVVAQVQEAQEKTAGDVKSALQ